MNAVIAKGEASDNPTVRQYAKGLVSMLAFAGKTEADLEKMPGDLETYDIIAPKYDKRSARLVEAIAKKGWKPSTYRQHRGDGKRMIEHVSGELAARIARRAQEDVWSELRARAALLADAGLINRNRLNKLSRITDLARASGFEPTDLTKEKVISMRPRTGSAKEWNAARDGAQFM